MHGDTAGQEGIDRVTSVFDESHAAVYDALYANKDYNAECDLLESLFRKYEEKQVRSILDLGCGTGSHTSRLAKRGYRVTGVDQSAPMLTVASDKTKGRDVRLIQADIKDVNLMAAFDACLLMFAVLSYQVSNDDVRKTLRAVRRHLDPGGLLIFDVWHGPGVLCDPPTHRERSLHSSGGVVKRRATPTVDLRHQLCVIKFELVDAQGHAVLEETHALRFFFPLELTLLLEAAGFELLLLAPFSDPSRQLHSRDWNVLCVARAR